MSDTKRPLNFAQALRTKAPATIEDAPALPEVVSGTEALPQMVDSQTSAAVDSHHLHNKDSHEGEMVDSHISTAPAIHQQKAASQLSTMPTLVERKLSTRKKPAIHQSKLVDSRKGDRHARVRVPFNNRIDAEILQRIKHFCVTQGIELQEFVELSASYYLDAVDSHQVTQVDSKLAHDDRDVMIMYKSIPSIINLYLRYNTENRWKPADDRAAYKYNEVDLRIIELGLIQTQFNARFKRIHSFQYYAAEIDMCRDTPLESGTIDIMLRQNRRRWETAKAELAGKGEGK